MFINAQLLKHYSTISYVSNGHVWRPKSTLGLLKQVTKKSFTFLPPYTFKYM